jgi:peptide chain release factor 1
MGKYLSRIAEAVERARELETELLDPEISKEPGKYQKLAKQLGHLRPILEAGERYQSVVAQLEDSQAMVDDADRDLAELARAEVEDLQSELEQLDTQLAELFTAKDPNDEKNVVFEIRAGTGGDEAALFAADLFRMYTRYAETLGWKVEPLTSSLTPGGGFKEVIAMMVGDGAYSRFKYERGVHRVQRVPSTESQGRIHTSTVTVAVMPEAEEVEVVIPAIDLRIDVMRAGGPGGQSVNTTDSAVRITHLPTNLVVQCQDEKSQHKNKAKAMRILASRLLDSEQRRIHAERAAQRKSQVGSGDRSARIRTYNWPQNRISDHRLSENHSLEQVVAGKLDSLLEALECLDREERIRNL